MKLMTKGVKGVDHELELGRLTLLTGPNGSGKSTAADSVRFLALGYVPALGKRPVDTAALMHNGAMSVELVLEDGRAVKRSLERHDKGFTQGAEASWIRNGKPAETAKAITGLFGSEEQDVAECLDIRELLAATPNQRAARLEQLLKSGSRSPQETADAVARWVVMRLADTTEERMPANYMDAMPMVPAVQVGILREAAPMLLSKITEAQIQGAITWANERKRDAAQGLQRREGAAYELRKRAAQVPEPDERDMKRLEEEKVSSHRQLAVLQERAATWGTRAARANGLRDSLAQAKEMSASLERRLKDAEAVHSKRIEELDVKRAELMDEIPVPVSKRWQDDAKVSALQKEYVKLESERDAVVVPELLTCDREEMALQSTQNDLERAKSSDWAEVLQIGRTLKKAKTHSDIGRRLEELARKGLGADIDGLEHEVERTQKAFNEAAERSDARAKERKAAIEKRDALAVQTREKSAAFDRARAELETAQRKMLADYQKVQGERAVARRNVESAIASNRETLEIMRGEKSSADRRIASLQDQLAGLGELGPAPEGLEALQAKLRVATEDLEKLIQARAVHQEIQLALKAIEEAKASRDVFTAIEWALQRQREVEISEAGGVLLGTVRSFLEAAGRKEVPFVRAGAGLCAIGWTAESGKEIQIQALSGGEWCLFAAALTASVVLARDGQVKILLVEAGETDDRHLIQLLRGLGAVGKGLTAAVVMTPRAVAAPLPSEWMVVNTDMAKV